MVEAGRFRRGALGRAAALDDAAQSSPECFPSARAADRHALEPVTGAPMRAEGLMESTS